MRAIHSTILVLAGVACLSVLTPALAQTTALPASDDTTSKQNQSGSNDNPVKNQACEVCTSVLGKVKKGAFTSPEALCIARRTDGREAEALCKQVISDLNKMPNLKFWLFQGCYEKHADGTRDWINPCPDKVQCSMLAQADGKLFCPSPDVPASKP